jgi:hypothetical protein
MPCRDSVLLVALLLRQSRQALVVDDALRERVREPQPQLIDEPVGDLRRELFRYLVEQPEGLLVHRPAH